jgi:hypothetical protein
MSKLRVRKHTSIHAVEDVPGFPNAVYPTSKISEVKTNCKVQWNVTTKVIVLKIE